MSKLHWTAMVVGLLLGIGTAGEHPADSPQRKVFSASPTKKAAKELRQREGTKLLEVVGRFQLMGEKVSFALSEGEGVSYHVLENLALERVLDNLNESRADRLWLVTGTLTEFRGANHLLLTKAVIKTTESKELP